MRPRGITADRVVELCDGTRDAQQIADVMGVGIAYVRKTVQRRKVGHLLVVRPPNPSLKVQLRAAEAQIFWLTEALDAIHEVCIDKHMSNKTAREWIEAYSLKAMYPDRDLGRPAP